MRPFAVLGVVGLALAPGAWAGVAVVSPLHDTTLFQDAQGDTSSGAGPALFAGNNGQNLVHRALVRFDVAGAVPAGSLVDSVTLTLEVTSAPDAIPRTFTLHRVLADWGEGTSSSSGGAGAPATPGDATWLHTFYPGQFWLHAGGDFVAAASGSQIVGDPGTYVWSGALLAADVQTWLDRPELDFGWLIHGDETRPRTVRRFDSRESTNSAHSPTLTIHFSPAVVPAHSPTWGAVKARYR